MANYEVRLSVEQIEGDDTPEVTVVFWNRELANKGTDARAGIEFTAYVTAPGKGAPYDTVKSKADVDGNQEFDTNDDKILLELVNAFMKMNLSITS